MEEAKGGRLTSLDAIRGICAILVVVMHSSFLTNRPFFPSAYLVVDVFFAMSGYVIAHAYESKLRAGGYLLTYFWRRYARLLPMWAIGLGIGAGFSALLHHHWPVILRPLASLALGLFFVPIVGLDGLFPYNPPGWSLFYELLANFAFGLGARRLNLRWLLTIVLVAAPLLVLAIFSAQGADGGRTWQTAGVALARVSFSFSLGVLIHLKRDKLGGRKWHWSIFWAGMAALILLSCVSPPAGMRPLFDSLFILIGCPTILLLGLNASAGSRRFAEMLGTLSYPLYATHFALMIVIRSLYRLPHGFGSAWMSVGAGMSIVMGVLVAAYLLGHHVDPYAQAWLGRLTRQRPVQVPDVTRPPPLRERQ